MGQRQTFNCFRERAPSKILDRVLNTLVCATIFKRAPKLYPKITFVSTAKIDGNVINVLNCYFSDTKYIHMENQNYIS